MISDFDQNLKINVTSIWHQILNQTDLTLEFKQLGIGIAEHWVQDPELPKLTSISIKLANMIAKSQSSKDI